MPLSHKSSHPHYSSFDAAPLKVCPQTCLDSQQTPQGYLSPPTSVAINLWRPEWKVFPNYCFPPPQCLHLCVASKFAFASSKLLQCLRHQRFCYESLSLFLGCTNCTINAISVKYSVDNLLFSANKGIIEMAKWWNNKIANLGRCYSRVKALGRKTPTRPIFRSLPLPSAPIPSSSPPKSMLPKSPIPV